MLTDSLVANPDLLKQDSVYFDSILFPFKDYALFVNLKLFTKENTIQYVTSYNRPEKYKLELIFNHPLFENFLEINPINLPQAENWKLEERNSTNDTIFIWLTDTNLIKTDTLKFSVKYIVKDSLQNNINYSDTLKFLYGSKTDKKSRKRRKEEEQPEKEEEQKLQLALNIQSGGELDLNKNITFEAKSPAFNYNPEFIELYRLEDTIEIPVKTTFIKDSLKLRKFRLINDWEENSPYKLYIYPGAFEDIYGLANDTLIFEFRTKRADFYGRIFLNVKNCNKPTIIQLIDEKEKVILKKIISEDTRIVFDYLYPKKYTLKAVYDLNKNNKWDTGNYREKKQPEKVLYFHNSINVRSNWDIETEWRLE